MMNSTTSTTTSGAITAMAVTAAAVVAHAVVLSAILNKNSDANYNDDEDKNCKQKNTSSRTSSHRSNHAIQKTAPLCNNCTGNHHHDHHDSHDEESVVITLPEWTKKFVEDRKYNTYTTEEEMMKVALDLADQNITEGTGGPFGTAIFEHDVVTGMTHLFCVGINQVVSLGNSTLHGEMTAIQFGEKKLGKFSFPRANKTTTKDLLGSTKEYHLYTSCAPCAQCLGGTLWSGVSKLVCGADKADAEAIGFDEGPVFKSSYEALEAAGITVKHGVLREEGAAILRRYAETGVIYNADSS